MKIPYVYQKAVYKELSVSFFSTHNIYAHDTHKLTATPKIETAIPTIRFSLFNTEKQSFRALSCRYHNLHQLS